MAIIYYITVNNSYGQICCLPLVQDFSRFFAEETDFTLFFNANGIFSIKKTEIKRHTDFVDTWYLSHTLFTTFTQKTTNFLNKLPLSSLMCPLPFLRPIKSYAFCNGPFHDLQLLAGPPELN